jgi:ABC-type nickel/cobalt efflux system permease component RcnA
MTLPMSPRIRAAGASLLVTMLALTPLASHADTVASLLGNFTISQYCGLALADATVTIHYAVVFGQLPALRELHMADTDADGVTTQAERDAYVRRLAPQFADDLSVVVDGTRVPLQAIRWTSSLPTEQGGFSLRLDADFAGVLPPARAGRRQTLSFVNHNYTGKIGWNEITVAASAPIAVFDTNAFSTSLTAGLTEALAVLPVGGPLAERAIRLSLTRGAAPSGATLLAPRPGAAASSAKVTAQTTRSKVGDWLRIRTRNVIGLISTPRVPPQVVMLALLTAMVLGALHAVSPGHGKTIVGAYLIGSRGTARHAVFLGLVVTVTHTVGVFGLGFATLFASRFIVPERLLPILSLVSGVLVLGMGIVLLVSRSRGAQRAWSAPADHADSGTAPLPAGTVFFPIEAASGGSHEHGPWRADTSGMLHSHGGSVHSHLPPGAAGDAVTWQNLLALGISGGLVPCPSAMVLLLAAVALNKTAYGLLLVLAFSVGLAFTLTAVGCAFLYARRRLRRPSSSARWPRLLPILSAVAITMVGVALCAGAVQSVNFGQP